MHRRPHVALRIVLDAMLIVACLVWLPVIRGAFQPAYEWQLFELRGQGRAGDYPAMLGLAAFTWGVLFLGWRRSPSTLFAAGVLVWCAGLTAAVAWATLGSSEPLVIRGDTMGFELPVGWIGVGLAAAMLLLAAFGLVADRGRDPLQPAWTSGNRIALGAAALLAAVEAVCFVGADVNGLSSQIGVAAVLAQAAALGLSIRSSRIGHKAPAIVIS